MDIIDKNRNVYPKTDYLFIDFIFESLSSDDTYPIFQKMVDLNYPAHYITEKKEIYHNYCNNTKNCLTIINVNRYNYRKYADFIENHLTLILKLKAVISCKESNFHFISYLFYRIEYITYIAVTHGVCYFKDYLFEKERVYGIENNNKILIPPSEILINITKKYGWKDENIIKLNLPRWDKYNDDNNEFFKKEINRNTFTNNSLLIMFTWRYNRFNFNYDISPFYVKNITDLLTNQLLNQALRNKNITLYFSFHRYINVKYINIFYEIIKKNKNMKFINQNDIAKCLAKTSLVVTDFSSIIFDLMYRRKPIVIYVPDLNDKNINEIYTDDYIRLINTMDKGNFQIENKCYNVNQTVEKIIFYINNNFKLDSKLVNYYNIFGLKTNNNIDKFIKYLNNI
jgi:CDP-glycerol glycerophosphotransferase (TagB/SpsB family)